MTKTACRNSHSLDRPAERGVALIFAIFALALLTLLGLALTSMGMVSLAISTNEREGTQALYIADAGIVNAKGLMLSQLSLFDTFLTAGNGTACDWDELSPAPLAPLKHHNLWQPGYRDLSRLLFADCRRVGGHLGESGNDAGPHRWF